MKTLLKCFLSFTSKSTLNAVLMPNAQFPSSKKNQAAHIFNVLDASLGFAGNVALPPRVRNTTRKILSITMMKAQYSELA